MVFLKCYVFARIVFASIVFARIPPWVSLPFLSHLYQLWTAGLRTHGFVSFCPSVHTLMITYTHYEAFFYNIFIRFGCWNILTSDTIQHFICGVVATLVKESPIHHLRTTSVNLLDFDGENYLALVYILIFKFLECLVVSKGTILKRWCMFMFWMIQLVFPSSYW